MSFEHIKVIVFDLDGTLYEDTHHFDYYAKRIQMRLPVGRALLFAKDYLAFKNNKHTLKIGRVYDRSKDLILVQTDNMITEAYEWNGAWLSEEKVKRLYPKPVIFDFEKMISIGDPWWIPSSIAGHYGLPPEKSTEAFLETRDYMMSPEFYMTKIDGLKEAIIIARNKADTVLLTNSPEQDSEAILKKLNLSNLFSKKIFNGRKPTETVRWFEHIRRHFDVSFQEIMSVGDNLVNEIRPVKALGCTTAYIDAYGLGETSYTDITVPRIKGLFPILQQIGNS